ncbi:MAG: enoyl-CoA hydratase/isomerase family protein [Hyphomonadaceae bacterium]
MSSILLDVVEDGVAVLTLNRPERLNAIDDSWIDGMHAALDRLSADRSIRVVVLTGAGRGFCAGADLKREGPVIHDEGAGQVRDGMRGQERLSSIFERMTRLRQPIVAAVNGPAADGGFALALAADVRLASTKANFHVANARIGLSAGECGISWIFPRLVGLSRCFELMLTGRPFDAAEAERIGLLSRVTEPDALIPEALKLARAIAANAAFGVAMTKEVVWANLGARRICARGSRLKIEPRCCAS